MKLNKNIKDFHFSALKFELTLCIIYQYKDKRCLWAIY